MKLIISKDLKYSPERMQLVGEFVLYCAQNLPIEEDFKIFLVTDREKHNITTTALYEVGNNCCRIYAKSRALPDVFRSIAHEMTHMMQDEMGLIKGKVRDAGGFHEDQANAKAGELIKLFVKEKDHRKSIYEGISKLGAKYTGAEMSLDLGSNNETDLDLSGAGIDPDPNWPSPSKVTDNPSAMSVSSKMTDEIKRSEGFIPHVYDDLGGSKSKKQALVNYEDAKGTPTIGYGEAIFKSQPAKREKYRPYLRAGGRKMSESEASNLLAKTLRRHTRRIRSDVTVPLTQNMFDALASYCYNTGAGGLKKFGILGPLNKGDYVTAAKIIQSKPIKGKKSKGGSSQPLPGLVRRRKREASIFLTGTQGIKGLELGTGGDNSGSVLIAGDSQIGGYLGQTLAKNLGIPASARVFKNGAGGKTIAGLIRNNVKSATKGIIISFGGNDKGAGVNNLISVVKKSPIAKKDLSKIVFLGPPPAYNPTDYRYTKRVFDPKGKRGYDPSKWEKRRKQRKGYNDTIKNAVEAAGMTFISPYDYIANQKTGGKDGIHMSSKLANIFVKSIKNKLPKP